MVRSIIAVVVGFVVIGVLSFGTDMVLQRAMPGSFGTGGSLHNNVPLLLFTQVYVIVYAVFGCWLTARLAPDRPLQHALILGALGLVFNVVNTITLWDTAPAWYHVMALLLVMPAAWMGGYLRERQLADDGRRPLAV